MYKLFTLEEATRLIPLVDETLGDMQKAINDMLRLRQNLAGARTNSLQARNTAQEISFLLGVIHQDKAQLDRLGVHLKDIEAGLVDFPSKLGAEVVCLTWEKGQQAITRFHRLSGNTEPQPLTETKTARLPSA